jgi:hypothetical protein
VILLLTVADLIHLSVFIELTSFECKEFLHEFKDLDLPNEGRIMASFVLLEWRTDNWKLVNFGGALSTATERTDG